jgi:drug/metabolite transporter (DMT)-like permease
VSGLLTTAAQVGTALGVAGLVLVAGDGAHGAGFAVAAGLAAGAALLALTRVRPRAPSG